LSGWTAFDAEGSRVLVVFIEGYDIATLIRAAVFLKLFLSHD
jgi:hypothetical protein